MFWVEETDNGKSIVLFSQVSMDDYKDELSELGGLYMDKIQSKVTEEREGWVFPLNLKNDVNSFIEREAEDVQSSSTNDLTLDDLYDLLLEAFDRIAALEKKCG